MEFDPLEGCPTCRSKNVRVYLNRFQCADCNYNQPCMISCEKCGGKNLIFEDHGWSCLNCVPKKRRDFKKCPACKSSRISRNGNRARCNACGYKLN